MKKFLKGLVIVILLLIAVGFFLPGEVTVERSLVINAKPEQIYNMVVDVEQWKPWNPWTEADPTMELTMGDVTTGKGAWYSWVSQDMGNGKLTLTDVTPNSAISTKLEFDGQNPGNGSWTFEEVEGGTKVTWTMNADMGMAPWSRWFGLFFDDMVGPMFEKGLSNIDSVIQLTPPAPEYAVEIIEENVTAVPYLGISDTVSFVSDSMAAFYGNAYGMIGAWMAENGGTFGGMPFSIDHYMDEQGQYMVIEAGIPTNIELPGNDMIGSGMTYEGNTLRATHVGPYDSMNVTYDELFRYAKDNGITGTGPTWAVFVSDPGNTPEAELITYVYLPIN